MATLVHDDVLDAAPLRRGHATVWARHGEALARATGDHLFALAFAGLARRGLARRGRAAGAGRARPGARRGAAERAGAPPRDHRRGLPRALPLQDRPAVRGRLRASAACSAASTAPGIEALERFGEQLGIAFQLADDLLDCDGDPETTGKALGVDLLDGTVTLPLLLAAQRDAARGRSAARPRARGRGRGRAARARGRARGAIADTRRAVLEHADAARATLDALPDRSDRRALEAIVQAATTRDH